MRRTLFIVLVGLGGAAILLGLGTWQMQRLAWKEGVLARIEARIGAAPGALPADPDAEADAYLPVRVTGTTGEDYLRVLVSQKIEGAGYRIITALDTDAGAILLDRGFVRADAALPVDAPAQPQSFTGNLQWPDETDSFTPAPDLRGNIWYARDLPAMAEALGTRPILLVQRDPGTGPWAEVATPLPIDTSRIPNNHLQYALTWYGLAIVWLAMSFYFWRRRAPASEG